MDINKLIDDLKNEYKYKVDIHSHTSPVSSCSRIPPEEMIDKYAELGYSAVAITNHFQPKMLLKTEDEAVSFFMKDFRAAYAEGEKTGVKVLLGIEINFEGNYNDYLVYGICEEDVRRVYSYIKRGMAAYYAECKTSRNLMIQAHPYRNDQTFTSDIVDGIEAYNFHPNHNSRPAIAERSAAELKMLHTMGTDLHYPEHTGLTAVRFKSVPQDSYQLAEMLKSGDFIFGISDDILLPRRY